MVLLVKAVVRVAVLLPEFSVPLAVPVTPAGNEAVHAKVEGLIVEETLMTALLPEQMGPTVWGAVATGRGYTVTLIVATAGLQGPAGSFVVKVMVATPVKFAGGVQVAFMAFTFENVPAGLEDHVALEAAPPKEPFKVRVPFMHAPFGYTPALAVAMGLKVMVVCAVATGQGAGGWPDVKVSIMFPE